MDAYAVILLRAASLAITEHCITSDCGRDGRTCLKCSMVNEDFQPATSMDSEAIGMLC